MAFVELRHTQPVSTVTQLSNGWAGPKGNGLKVWLRVLNFKPAVSLKPPVALNFGGDVLQPNWAASNMLFSVVNAGNDCTYCGCESPFSWNQLLHPHTIWKCMDFCKLFLFDHCKQKSVLIILEVPILPLSNPNHWFGRQFAKRLQRNRCR